MANPVPTLTCAQCGFVNEAERVYCHNCGTKLDRSVLPREDESTSKEAIDKTLRRVKKMTNPEKSLVRRESIAAAKCFGSALGIALFLCAFREPAGLPPSKFESTSRIISTDMAEAVESTQPRQVAFSENDLNSHFQSTIRAKSGSSVIPGVSFARAFVQLNPGVCTVGMVQSLWGFPFYSRLNYKVQIVDGKFVATQTGGYFGRLAVHPLLMKRLDFAFDKLWVALKRERAQMNAVSSISIEKGRVVIVSKGVK